MCVSQAFCCILCANKRDLVAQFHEHFQMILILIIDVFRSMLVKTSKCVCEVLGDMKIAFFSFSLNELAIKRFMTLSLFVESGIELNCLTY